MKKIFCSLVVCVVAMLSGATSFADTFSCGDGYILVAHSKIDGINAMACEKLWCRDLETGRTMGSGNTAASGYRMTDEPVLLSDDKGNEIMCFGDRKWCSGEVVGEWNPGFGGYTRDGADNATYKSYQKGGCFAWRLERPSCSDGETAFLVNDEWVCTTEETVPGSPRESAMRRTGIIRMR